MSDNPSSSSQSDKGISRLEFEKLKNQTQFLTEQLNVVTKFEDKANSWSWYTWLAGVIMLSVAVAFLVGWQYCFAMVGIGILLWIPKSRGTVSCLLVSGSGGLSLWSLGQQFCSANSINWIPATLVGLTMIGIVVISLSAMVLIVKSQLDE